MEIGERLKEARVQKGMTQEEAADRIGVSRVTISHWENGKSLPDIASLIRFSDLYQISLDELVKGDEKMTEKVKNDSEDLKGSKKALLLTGALILLTSGIDLASRIVGGHFREFMDGALVYILMGLGFLAATFIYQVYGHSEK